MINSGRIDYYQLLGVSKNASQQEIEKAYRTLAKQTHPDKNEDPQAEEKMKWLNTARDILKDPERRQNYDLGQDENSSRNATPYPPPTLVNELNTLIQKLIQEKNDNDESFYRHSKFIEQVEKFLAQINKEKSSIRIQLRNEVFLKSTIRMLEELLKTQNNSEVIMYEYGKNILNTYIEFDLAEDEIEELLRMLGLRSEDEVFKIAQQLIFGTLKLELHLLELFPLDHEIKEIERIAQQQTFFSDKQKEQQTFVTSLKTFRQSIHADLEAMHQNKKYTKKEISESDSNKLAQDTVQMLRKLKYQEHAKEDDEIHLMEYGDKIKNANKATNFFKAAWSVFLGGIGLILGGAIGLVAGAIKGQVICSVVTAPIGLVVGAKMGAEYGIELGKKSTGIPFHRSVSRHLFFQTPEIAAKDVSRAGLNLMNNKKLQEREQAVKKDGIDPEVLCRYAMIR